jgi:hypothetical protein
MVVCVLNDAPGSGSNGLNSPNMSFCVQASLPYVVPQWSSIKAASSSDPSASKSPTTAKPAAKSAPPQSMLASRGFPGMISWG